MGTGVPQSLGNVGEFHGAWTAVTLLLDFRSDPHVVYQWTAEIFHFIL